jgi:hypothetical protein
VALTRGSLDQAAARDSAQPLIRRLQDASPRIPRRLDGELLQYAARFGLMAAGSPDIGEDSRFSLRAGFWEAVHEAAPGSFAPPAAAHG